LKCSGAWSQALCRHSHKEVAVLVTRSRARRRVAAAVAVPALLLFPGRSALTPAAPGITYTFKSSTILTESNGKTKEIGGMVGRGQVAGTDARFDIVSSKTSGQGEAFGKGAYFLFTEGGQTMTVVKPQEKQYFEMDLAGMLRMVTAMGPIMKMEVSDVNIDAQPAGAGETIEGYATQKYRLVQNYTMKLSILGMKQTSKVVDTTIYWFAPQLKLVANPFTRVSGISSMFNSPDFDRKMKAAMAKLAQGAPLRMLSRSVSDDGKGKTQVNTTTVEITEVKRGDVPASAFEIPAGFAKIQSPTLSQAQMDSLQAAQNAAGQAQGGEGQQGAPTGPTSVSGAAAQGAQDVAKEAAKASAKKKIGKIFGRP
jgi:hypothetical protein